MEGLVQPLLTDAIRQTHCRTILRSALAFCCSSSIISFTVVPRMAYLYQDAGSASGQVPLALYASKLVVIGQLVFTSAYRGSLSGFVTKYNFAIRPSAVKSSAITLYGLPPSSRMAPTPPFTSANSTLEGRDLPPDADQEPNHAVRSDDGVEGGTHFAAAIGVQDGILRQQGGELGWIAGGTGGEKFAQHQPTGDRGLPRSAGGAPGCACGPARRSAGCWLHLFRAPRRPPHSSRRRPRAAGKPRAPTGRGIRAGAGKPAKAIRPFPRVWFPPVRPAARAAMDPRRFRVAGAPLSTRRAPAAPLRS